MPGRATRPRSVWRSRLLRLRPARCSSCSTAGPTERSRSSPSSATAAVRVFVPALSGGSRRDEPRARPLRDRVLGAAAAFRRGEPAAFGGDRAALDTVRGREVHLHGPVAVGWTDLVHLRGAHLHPHLRQLAPDAPLYPDVIRLVVARAVP